MVGADVFVESRLSPDELGRSLEELCGSTPFGLKMISNRGTKVYPATGALPDCVDHYRCRFVARSGVGRVSQEDVLKLLGRTSSRHRWMHVEILEEIAGEPGFTRAQGED